MDTTFEMPFLDQHVDDPTGAELLEQLRARLPRILDAAAKLILAGWSMQRTINGLSFKAPSDQTNETSIEKQLTELGIDTEIEWSPSRTLAEIGAAEQAFADRVWYERKLTYLKEPGPDRHTNAASISGMLKAMREVERRYGNNLTVENDYEWGTINGKLSTLRWILGHEWDMLDT
jgi:hypothetical protein